MMSILAKADCKKKDRQTNNLFQNTFVNLLVNTNT